MSNEAYSIRFFILNLLFKLAFFLVTNKKDKTSIVFMQCAFNENSKRELLSLLLFTSVHDIFHIFFVEKPASTYLSQ